MSNTAALPGKLVGEGEIIRKDGTKVPFLFEQVLKDSKQPVNQGNQNGE